MDRPIRLQECGPRIMYRPTKFDIKIETTLYVMTDGIVWCKHINFTWVGDVFGDYNMVFNLIYLGTAAEWSRSERQVLQVAAAENYNILTRMKTS